MNKTNIISSAILLALLIGCSPSPRKLTDYVIPFLGTATLWDSVDLGYKPTHRAWGGETFPGATLPFGMVQVTPVTLFGSGSGYQYEDTVIFAFFHTSMGHWNMGHVPLLPFTGEITANNYHSTYSKDRESARPGYYQVYLERYGVNAEMTSTLRCAFHKFTYEKGGDKKLMFNLTRTNQRRAGVNDWGFNVENENTFSGYQRAGDPIYFYGVANHKITGIDTIRNEREAQQGNNRGALQRNNREALTVVNFADQKGALELKIGFSFVSVEKAKMNLEFEMLGKTFVQVKKEADET